MDEDGSAEGGRTRLARGTKPYALTAKRGRASDAGARVAPVPVSAGGAPSSADRAPAQSIREAVEQLLEAREADEAVAEWMLGGG